jgi:hypothetical protein
MDNNQADKQKIVISLVKWGAVIIAITLTLLIIFLNTALNNRM